MIKIPKWLADFGLLINSLYYKQLLYSIYYGKKQQPTWFDHRIDLYYLWPYNLFWLERGVLPRKYMLEGCTVLDLFCGDGFYSHYFYSTIAGHIDAIDKDPSAIAHAKRWHSQPKINYVVLDAVKKNFPRSRYDVIVWFEGIEHLNAAAFAVIVKRIKAAMGITSVLVGSTPIISDKHQNKGNWEHQNEFTSIPQLRDFQLRDFADIQIEMTVYPILGGGQRRTAYFTLRNPK